MAHDMNASSEYKMAVVRLVEAELKAARKTIPAAVLVGCYLFFTSRGERGVCAAGETLGSPAWRRIMDKELFLFRQLMAHALSLEDRDIVALLFSRVTPSLGFDGWDIARMGDYGPRFLLAMGIDLGSKWPAPPAGERGWKS